MVDQALLDQISEHITLYRRDPEAGHDWTSKIDGKVYPTLLLTMTGRRSGKDLIRPLIYAQNGSDFLIVASLGGAPDHPAWYKNLISNPDCRIQVRDEHYDVRARTASEEEHGPLWKKVSDVFQTYDDYQARTDRRIPIVVLERHS